jgi:hypothetical protein
MEAGYAIFINTICSVVSWGLPIEAAAGIRDAEE